MLQKHVCHWPGCTREVLASMWGCTTHWFKAPQLLRDAMRRQCRPGQGVAGTPSAKYLRVARLAHLWCEAFESNEEILPDLTEHFHDEIREAGL